MRTRIELHEKLCDILGSRNCYFSPPSNIRMKYPCFVYSAEGTRSDKADNTRYVNHMRYTVTYIDENPDSDMPTKLLMDLDLMYVSHDRTYVADGLNHFVYTVYW